MIMLLRQIEYLYVDGRWSTPKAEFIEKSASIATLMHKKISVYTTKTRTIGASFLSFNQNL